MNADCGLCRRWGKGCHHHPDEVGQYPGSDGKSKVRPPNRKGVTVVYDPEKHCGHPTHHNDGLPCRMTKGQGTEHKGVGYCQKHGGNTPTHRKSAQKKIAQEAVVTFGLPIEIDPFGALIDELHRTYGHVKWLAEYIGEMEPEALVFGTSGERTVKVRRKGQDDWELRGVRQISESARPSVWLEEYNTQRTKLITVAKACVAAGIMERQTKIVEGMAQSWAMLLQGMIRGLEKAGKIQRGDPDIPKIARAALGQLPTEAIDV